MSKTKCLKNKNNKTIKRGGGPVSVKEPPVKKIEPLQQPQQPQQPQPLQQPQQPQQPQLQPPQQLDEITNTIGDFAKKTTNDLAYNLKNTVHKQVVDVLNSPELINGTKNALEIISTNAKRFNDTYGTPETKKNIEDAVTNASNIASVVIDASKKPINNAVDELTNAGIRAASEGSAGAVKVGTDVLAAVPGVGAIIELGKIANDASVAAANITEAVSDATEIVSKTKQEIDQSLNNITQENERMLSQQQKVGKQISDRTNKTMSEFTSPPSYKQTGGYQKSKRRLLKRKSKTKRVTFAI